jgi:hypothetical protein
MSKISNNYTHLKTLSPQAVLRDTTRISLIAAVIGIVLAPLTNAPYLLPATTLYLTFTSLLIGDAFWCRAQKCSQTAKNIFQLIPLQTYLGSTLLTYSIQLFAINHLGAVPSVGYLGPSLVTTVTYMIEGYLR